jgi:hypothetical protein
MKRHEERERERMLRINLKPCPMSCVRSILASYRAGHGAGHQRDSRVGQSTLKCEVTAML